MGEARHSSQLGQKEPGTSQRHGEEGGGTEEDKWWEHVAVPGRWLGLVAGMWLLSCAGSSATYAIYSPALKSVGGYNQQQLDSLAVAKDMGESVGILQGLLCDTLPVWGLVLSGSLHYLVGFSALWAVAASHIKPLSFPVMWGLMLLGSQGTAWFNTAVLVTSVRNFPRSRGTVVGLLKGLVGLSGAIFAQAYTALIAPDQADYLALIALLPFVVSVPAMLFLRPVQKSVHHHSHNHIQNHNHNPSQSHSYSHGRNHSHTHTQSHHLSPQELEYQEQEERGNLNVILTICLLLSAYLFGAMLLPNYAPRMPHWVDAVLLVGMVGFLVLPLYIPLRHAWHALAAHSSTSSFLSSGSRRSEGGGQEAGAGGEEGEGGEVRAEEEGEEEDEFDQDAGEGTTRHVLSRSESYDSLFSELSTVNSISDFQTMLGPGGPQQQQEHRGVWQEEEQEGGGGLGWLGFRQLKERAMFIGRRMGKGKGAARPARMSEDIPRSPFFAGGPDLSPSRVYPPSGTPISATSASSSAARPSGRRGGGTGLFEPLLPSSPMGVQPMSPPFSHTHGMPPSPSVPSPAMGHVASVSSTSPGLRRGLVSPAARALPGSGVEYRSPLLYGVPERERGRGRQGAGGAPVPQLSPQQPLPEPSLEGRGEVVLLQRGLAARGPLFSVGGGGGEGALVGLKALVSPPVQAQGQALLPPQVSQPRHGSPVSRSQQESQRVPEVQAPSPSRIQSQAHPHSQSQSHSQSQLHSQTQEQGGVEAVAPRHEQRVPQEQQLHPHIHPLPPALQSVHPGTLQMGSKGDQGSLQQGQHHSLSLPRPHLSAPQIGPSGAAGDPEQALPGVGQGSSISSQSWPRCEPGDEQAQQGGLGQQGRQEPLRRVSSRSGLRRGEASLLLAVGEGAVKIAGRRRKGPRRGEDFTLGQAVVKADFWLLFFSFAIGCGSGLTAINNLAQMGIAQGYVDVRVYVSLISICNFVGRLLAGYISEHVVKDYALPRPVMLFAAQGLMSVGHLMFAIAFPWGSLAIGSTLVGLAYGVHWAIMPATASELFGLKHFGMLYNTLTAACPLASFVFSGLIAGYLYDREAQQPNGVAWGSYLPQVLGGGFFGSVADGGDMGGARGGPGWGGIAWGPFLWSAAPAAKECFGAHCFRLTFILMAGACGVAMVLSFVLYWRTRSVYATLYTLPLKRQLEQNHQHQQQQQQQQQQQHLLQQEQHARQHQHQLVAEAQQKARDRGQQQ